MAALHLSPQVSSRAVAVPEEAADRGQETLERLLAWVADMEELVSNQKPPSAEAKVVKAQLEEQKVSGAGRPRVPCPGIRGARGSSGPPGPCRGGRGARGSPAQRGVPRSS